MPKKPLQPQDKYVLRLPDGLRERIKTYANEHGRSMNTQIVRLLEREFPEPVPVRSRVKELAELLGMLRAGASIEGVDELIKKLLETFADIRSGRLQGLDDETRSRLTFELNAWELERAANASESYFEDFDEVEAISHHRSGQPIKIVSDGKVVRSQDEFGFVEGDLPPDAADTSRGRK